MVNSNTRTFDETKKIALIDTLGQLEALISIYFTPKNSDDNSREKFYVGTLLDDLVKQIKMLIDEILQIYSELIMS